MGQYSVERLAWAIRDQNRRIESQKKYNHLCNEKYYLSSISWPFSVTDFTVISDFGLVGDILKYKKKVRRFYLHCWSQENKKVNVVDLTRFDIVDM